MKIAIIGGGFAGLGAGVELVDNGEKVVIYEAGEKLGGLAGGVKAKNWEWSLEKFYHHIFKNDMAIIKLAEKVGWPAFFITPVTNSWIENEEKQLDSPISLLKFNKLGVISRIWMGVGLAILKIIPNGQFLEKFKTIEVLPKLVGQEGYEKIWLPLLKAKFGSLVGEVNMAWFWARIAKRTQSLGYFKGGFEKLAEKTGEYISKKGGEIRVGVSVEKMEATSDGKYKIGGESFDRVIVTTPAPLVDKIIGKGKVSWPKIKYLWGQTLVLELKDSLIGSYWLNVLDRGWPFLVMVEHTNFIDRKYYGNNRVVYLGNYLEDGDQRLKMSEEELFKLYLPYLKKVNTKFEAKQVKNKWKLQAPFAQPVFPINYSKMVPTIETELPGVVVANMSMVYPWDRGTNYAVEIGQRAAKKILKK